MEAFKEAVGGQIDIGKQKVVWILKHKEQHKEAAGSALTMQWCFTNLMQD
jgi:hypothetical protein